MGSRPTPAVGRRLIGRPWRAFLLALLLLAACGTADDDDPAASRPTTTEDGPARPNVVLVVTDDQTLEQMRFLEQTEARLGGAGVTFEDAVVSYPTCCPSRATILTGQYASNHGVVWNAPPTGGFRAFEGHDTAMPAALADAGYQTIHVGRFLNGYGFGTRDRYQPEGWTDWHALVAPTDGQYHRFSMLENGDLVTYGADDYVTDVLADVAIDSIDRSVEAGRPFFLQLAFTAPHAAYGKPLADLRPGDIAAEVAEGRANPAVPAPRHEGSLDALALPAVASFDEADVSDKPALVRNREPIDPEWVRRNYQASAESLLAVDEAMVRLLDHLADAGIEDDTYVIFTSDNGFFHGEHGIDWGKYLPYEETVRVPLVIAGPDIPAGERRGALVANVDLAPTILEWTGVRARRVMDGVSLVGLLAADADDRDRAVLIEGHAPSGPGRSPYRGVRTSRWSYIEWEAGDVELYDLETDRAQMENLAGDPQHAEIRSALADATARLATCIGDGCQAVRVG